MPWDASPNAGFTTGAPWLPLNPDFPARNVAALAHDRRSILTLYRRLLALRRDRAALRVGDHVGLPVQGEVLVFERRSGAEERLLVALNLGHAPQRVGLPAAGNGGARVLLSTALDREEGVVGQTLLLRPAEGVILDLGRP
jgi:glycosidase